MGTLAALEEEILDPPAPRTAEQVVDVVAADEVMGVTAQQCLVEPMTEAHKVSGRDQILPSAGEQIFEVLGPQMTVCPRSFVTTESSGGLSSSSSTLQLRR